MTESQPTLRFAVADPGALRRSWETEVQKGRLAIPDDPSVPLLAAVSVALVLDGQEVARIAGRTVHRGGGWLGLQVAGVTDEMQAAYERALARAERQPDAKEPKTADARPIALRYAEMGPAEKTQVALRGDRDGRLQVMKEGNPNLLKFLLQNPRTTPQELATLAGNASSSLDLLKLISDHPMLPQNESIRVALVKNPRAPVPLVKQHIEKLSQGQLAQLGKSPHVRDEVRRLALKRVLDRRV